MSHSDGRNGTQAKVFAGAWSARDARRQLCFSLAILVVWTLVAAFLVIPASWPARNLATEIAERASPPQGMGSKSNGGVIVAIEQGRVVPQPWEQSPHAGAVKSKE